MAQNLDIQSVDTINLDYTMNSKLLVTFFAICASVVMADEAPVRPAFWKGTILDSHIEKMKTACAADDTIACLQYKAFKFLDSVFRKDYFQLSDNVEVKRNTYPTNEVSARSDSSLEDNVEDFIKTHDVKFNIPVFGDLTVDSTGLDNEEINLKWNFGSGRAIEARKKSKIKKILSPILIFLLLKVVTLVPFAIGVLGLKAWNGLQLAFISFVISSGLAIFQLCQKLAADHAHAHIATAPIETYSSPWGRSLDDAQQMAYSAYSQ